MGDWYHDEHPVLLKQFINIANPGGAEPIPGSVFLFLLFQKVIIIKKKRRSFNLMTYLDSGLIYFAQNASYLGPLAGTSTSGSTVGFNENTTLPFVPGKTYRLRIINTSAFAAFFFWIDGHEMSIIEVDGVSTPTQKRSPAFFYFWS